uniref:Metastasis-associated protein MTA3 n=1 Tax=Meloidogyne incognita TaxID=6306 RepID=A0A914NCR9_MELIC
MSQNMYKVGDYVYFEAQPAAPFHIRRIEELNKTSTGAVEAKVTCFFRRRDLPDSILKIADQAERQNKILSKPRRTLLDLKESVTSSAPLLEANGGDSKSASPKENGLPESSNEAQNSANLDDGKKESCSSHSQNNNDEGNVSSSTTTFSHPKCYGFAGLPRGATNLSSEQLHELRQKELFLSRIVETLPATQIRGKCLVVILNEVETCDMYIGKDDSFFYSLVYDPSNQTLLADKGRIEIGNRHQAIIPDLLNEKNKNDLETMECDDDGSGNGGVEDDEEKMDDGIGNEEKNGHEDKKAEEKLGNKKAEEEDDDKASSSSLKEASTKTSKNSTKQQFHFEGETRRERCVYHPYHNLSDLEIDQFLLISRAVGTFSRALDSSSSIKIPTLHQTAAAASRDITLLHAMALLHQSNYDMGKVVATGFLVPPADNNHHYPLETDKLTSNKTVILGGPILCRDQLEEWSASESTLFEEGAERCVKDFHDIRQDYLPWKSIRDIVEYYYMWKTTSRYAERKKAKHTDRENKLNQVYIPSYNKPSINLINSAPTPFECVKSNYPCEGCNIIEAYQWYLWGPANQLRLCGDCWNIWKKRGGLTNPHELDTFDLEGLNEGGRSAVSSGQTGANRQNVNSKNSSSNSGPQQQQQTLLTSSKNVGGSLIPSSISGQILIGQKGRVAFCLNAPLETRIARRIAPKQIFNVRKAARAPFFEFDLKTVQDYYFCRPLSDILQAARQLPHGNHISRSAIEHLSNLHKKRAIIANGGK